MGLGISLGRGGCPWEFVSGGLRETCEEEVLPFHGKDSGAFGDEVAHVNVVFLELVTNA
jgi:hypothetical protein